MAVNAYYSNMLVPKVFKHTGGSWGWEAKFGKHVVGTGGAKTEEKAKKDLALFLGKFLITTQEERTPKTRARLVLIDFGKKRRPHLTAAVCLMVRKGYSFEQCTRDAGTWAQAMLESDPNPFKPKVLDGGGKNALSQDEVVTRVYNAIREAGWAGGEETKFFALSKFMKQTFGSWALEKPLTEQEQFRVEMLQKAAKELQESEQKIRAEVVKQKALREAARKA